MKGRIRGVNTSGNRSFGYIADATITLSDGTVRIMSGSAKSKAQAIWNMWQDWKAQCQEDFGCSIFINNEGNDIYS